MFCTKRRPVDVLLSLVVIMLSTAVVTIMLVVLLINPKNGGPLSVSVTRLFALQATNKHEQEPERRPGLGSKHQHTHLDRFRARNDPFFHIGLCDSGRL